jgi:hypothetical protein
MRKLFRITLKLGISFGICTGFGCLLSLFMNGGDCLLAVRLILVFFLAVVLGMWVAEDL